MTIVSGTVRSPIKRRLLVSIVNYNTWSDTTTCVRSLIETYTPSDGIALSISVWDNGSEPAPVGLGDLEGKLCVRSSGKNLGFGRGHNKNLQASGEADWILILNPDTVVNWASVALLIQHLVSHPEVAAVSPQLRGADGTIEISCRRLPSFRSEIARSFGLDTLGFGGTLMSTFDHVSRSYVEQPPGAALLLDATILKCLDGFDENFPLYFEDVDLCSRVAQFGKIEFVPGAVFFHQREGTARRFRTKTTFWIEYSRRIYLRKHFCASVAFCLGCTGCIGLFVRGSLHAMMALSRISQNDQVRTVHAQKASGYLLALASVFGGSRQYWLKRMMDN